MCEKGRREIEKRYRRERESERCSNITESKEEREDALEHSLLKGFSTGRPTEEGALARTELLLLLLLLLNCDPWRPPVVTLGMTPQKEQPQAQGEGSAQTPLM